MNPQTPPESAAPAETRTAVLETTRGVGRRGWLIAAAVLAAGAGAALGWRRYSLADPEPDVDVWQHSFPTPDGQTLALADLKGRPLLVNFWATWCPPCIEELPLLSQAYTQKQKDGWQILGIAIDQPDPVRRFLERSPVSFPVVLADLSAVNLTKALGNTAGGLPFTVVYDANGRLRHRKLGQLKPEDLQAWLK